MVRTSLVLGFLACLVSFGRVSHAQPRGNNPVFRYNIGGPGTLGYIPEQRAWLSSPNTRTSILNKPVTGSIPGLVLKTHRWAQFPFQITIPISVPGIYTCSVHWAETSDFFKGPGKRVFNIVLNGRKLSNIDVFKAVGFRKELKRTIKDIEISGSLKISLQKIKGDPYLAAVICTRTGPRRDGALPTKFDLNLGGPRIKGFFVEKRKWLSSPKVFSTFTTEKVTGNLPNFFTGTHRWSKSSWNIKIPIAVPGRYDCECTWAETSPFFRGNGKRVFDVNLNGARKYNIDVHRAVGFLTQYRVPFFYVKINGLLTVTLEKNRGDPFLAGVSCRKVGNL